MQSNDEAAVLQERGSDMHGVTGKRVGLLIIESDRGADAFLVDTASDRVSMEEEALLG